MSQQMITDEEQPDQRQQDFQVIIQQNNPKHQRFKSHGLQNDDFSVYKPTIQEQTSRNEPQVYFPVLNQRAISKEKQSRNASNSGVSNYIMVKQTLDSKFNDYSMFDEMMNQSSESYKQTVMSITNYTKGGIIPPTIVSNNSRNFKSVIGHQKGSIGAGFSSSKFPNPYIRNKQNSLQRSFDSNSNNQYAVQQFATIDPSMESKLSIRNRSRFEMQQNQSQFNQLHSTYFKERQEREIRIRRVQADMFADHTIQAATLRRERLAKSIERMKEKAHAMQMNHHEQIRKQEMLSTYMNKFGVKVSPREMEKSFKNYGENQLRYILENRLQNRRQNLAAVIIQKNFKMFQCMQAYQKVRDLRRRAVKIIQSSWKRFRWLRLIPKMRALKFNKSAITIQKYLRGFLVQRKMAKTLASMKIDSVFNYFNGIRELLYIGSQIVIAYHWRRYAKKKQLKLEKKRQNEQLRQQRAKKVPNYMLGKGAQTDKASSYKNNRVGIISGGGGSTNIQLNFSQVKSMAEGSSQQKSKITQKNMIAMAMKQKAQQNGAQTTKGQIDVTPKMTSKDLIQSPLQKRQVSKNNQSSHSNRTSNDISVNGAGSIENFNIVTAQTFVEGESGAQQSQETTSLQGENYNQQITPDDEYNSNFNIDTEQREMYGIGENELQLLIEEQSEDQEEDQEQVEVQSPMRRVGSQLSQNYNTIGGDDKGDHQ